MKILYPFYFFRIDPIFIKQAFVKCNPLVNSFYLVLQIFILQFAKLWQGQCL